MTESNDWTLKQLYLFLVYVTGLFCAEFQVL